MGSCSKCPKREEEENTDFSKTNLQFHIMEFSNYLFNLKLVKLPRPRGVYIQR